MKANELKDMLIKFRSIPGLKKEKIRERLNKEIKLNPKEVSNYISLALYYLSINDLRESLVNIKKSLIFKPENENLWFLQGEIFENTKYFKQAFESYYYAYRLGSNVAKNKLLSFCNGQWISNLDLKQKQIIEGFKETIC